MYTNFWKIPDLIMNSLLCTLPSFPFLSLFSSLFLPSKMQRQNRFNRRNERVTHQTEWSLARRIEGFFSSFFMFVLLHHANYSFWSYTFVCLSPSLFLHVWFHWLGVCFCFLLVWFGPVWSCWLCSASICLFYCSYVTGIYEHTSICLYISFILISVVL